MFVELRELLADDVIDSCQLVANGTGSRGIQLGCKL
jgi:hypothetical protein